MGGLPVPDTTTVVLGIVTTRSGEVETVDDLCRRIDDAARVVPLERLAISPHCGFASTIEGNPVTHDEQWRKLDVLVRAAELVWGQPPGPGSIGTARPGRVHPVGATARARPDA